MRPKWQRLGYGSKREWAADMVHSMPRSELSNMFKGNASIRDSFRDCLKNGEPFDISFLDGQSAQEFFESLEV